MIDRDYKKKFGYSDEPEEKKSYDENVVNKIFDFCNFRF